MASKARLTPQGVLVPDQIQVGIELVERVRIVRAMQWSSPCRHARPCNLEDNPKCFVQMSVQSLRDSHILRIPQV